MSALLTFLVNSHIILRCPSMYYDQKRPIFLLIIIFTIHVCSGQMKNPETKKPGLISRVPSAAGSFYPADPQLLTASLKTAFSKSKPCNPVGDILAIVCPHAGYMYSAKVAASAYHQ